MAIENDDTAGVREAMAAIKRMQWLRDADKHATDRKGIIDLPNPRELGYIDAADCMAAGADYRERMLTGGNQVGKTMAGAHELAMHLTGIYPDWWEGRRYTHPITGWAGSENFQTNVRGVQRYLCGEEAKGTVGMGSIPGDNLLRVYRRTTESYSSCSVRHISGGVSKLSFYSYENGRKALQSDTADFVWADEEPELVIFSELQARLVARSGSLLLTYTPLLGLTEVTNMFLQDPQLVVVNDWDSRA